MHNDWLLAFEESRLPKQIRGQQLRLLCFKLPATEENLWPKSLSWKTSRAPGETTCSQDDKYEKKKRLMTHMIVTFTSNDNFFGLFHDFPLGESLSRSWKKKKSRGEPQKHRDEDEICHTMYYRVFHSIFSVRHTDEEGRERRRRDNRKVEKTDWTQSISSQKEQRKKKRRARLDGDLKALMIMMSWKKKVR